MEKKVGRPLKIKKEIDNLFAKAFAAKLKDALSETQKKKIIRMSCFVKEKRDSEGILLKLKARLVAGEDRTVFKESGLSSPTVDFERIVSNNFEHGNNRRKKIHEV